MSRLNKTFLLLTVAVVFFLTGCMTTQTFTNNLKSELRREVPSLKKGSSDYMVFKTDRLHFPDSAVTIQEKRSYLIPALVYWEKVNILKGEINPHYFVPLFLNVFNETAGEFNLKKHLGKKRLIVSLDSVPSGFVYTNRFYGVIPCFSWYYEKIHLVDKKIQVTYQILDGDQVVKTGLYSQSVFESQKNVYYSDERFLENYIGNIIDNFKRHTEKVVFQVIDDLN